MAPSLVVGAPVWNRAWALPVWFDSLEANIEDPGDVGLIFVVPPSDSHSREVIQERALGYAFVEVLRDPYTQYDREVRRQDKHVSLAAARNLLLTHVCGVRPDWFLSWDSDFLVAPGVLSEVRQQVAARPGGSVSGVWAWLNRKAPTRGKHWDEQAREFIDVEWDEPPCFTAMQWDSQHPGVALHLDPKDWNKYAQGYWECDVVLAWQLMKAPAYRLARYGPHPHGEDLPFNWQLRTREIGRYCYGVRPGVHLFDRSSALLEVQEGYPQVMAHAADTPLAAVRAAPESESLRVIGYFERQDAEVLQEH